MTKKRAYGAIVMSALMISGVAVADCGSTPKTPETVPSDGSKLTNTEYDAHSKAVEDYSRAFAKYVQCITSEHNAAMDDWQRVHTAYQAKNAKK